MATEPGHQANDPGAPVPQCAGASIERRMLIHEHRGIEHLVERLEGTAEMSGNMAAGDLVAALRGLLDAVRRTLRPHLEWEDDVCFAEVDRLTGTPWSTRILRFQHEQLRQAVERLEADWQALQEHPSRHEMVEVRAHLYELHALVSAHLEQEEAAVMPFLDVEGAQPRPS